MNDYENVYQEQYFDGYHRADYNCCNYSHDYAMKMVDDGYYLGHSFSFFNGYSDCLRDFTDAQRY